MLNDNDEEQTDNEEKKPITEKEFLDGCVGCSSFGCLPFVVVFIVLMVKIF